MAAQRRKPVTGTFNVPRNRRDRIAASEAFDRAWENALTKAARAWAPDGGEVRVDVDVSYRARVDVWNPGGIGVCSVTLTPRG